MQYLLHNFDQGRIHWWITIENRCDRWLQNSLRTEVIPKPPNDDGKHAKQLHLPLLRFKKVTGKWVSLYTVMSKTTHGYFEYLLQRSTSTKMYKYLELYTSSLSLKNNPSPQSQTSGLTQCCFTWGRIHLWSDLPKHFNRLDSKVVHLLFLTSWLPIFSLQLLT